MTAAQQERIHELLNALDVTRTALRESDQTIQQLRDQLASRPIDSNMVQQREVPDRGFTRPTESELRQLYRVALALAPKLEPATPNDRHFQAFRTAFSYIATLSRTEKLDTSRATSWWCDGAEQYARAHGQSTDIGGDAFTLAALCHGDVVHSFSPTRWPYDMAFGLAIGGGSQATNKWRSVLERTQFLKAVELPMLPQQQQHWRPDDSAPVGLQN